MSWRAVDATSVDLTDDERRPLVLGGPTEGSVEVVVAQSTALRLIARAEAGDVERSLSVEATPRIEADLRLIRALPAAAEVELRWDSLGASRWALDVDGVEVTSLRATARGALTFVAAGEPPEATVRLRAWAGERSAEWTARAPVRPGETEPNDEQAEVARPSVVGHLDVGDRDLFELEVPAGGHVEARVEDTAGGCTIAATLRLLDAAGREVASHAGAQGCAELSGAVSGDLDLPAGRYRVELSRGEGDYLLTLSAEAAACGNGVVEIEAGERCEPARSPELCREDCTVDALGEVEPNASPAAAQLVPLGSVVAGRAHGTANDVDVYAVELSAPTYLAVEMTGPEPTECAFLIASLSLEQGGRTLARTRNDDLGMWCSRLTGHEAGLLPAGRYYLRVEANAFTVRRTPYYYLRVHAGAAAVCGDGRVEAAEACDDGNTTAGDGCDPTCAREPIARWTPRLEPYRLEAASLPAGGALVVELEAGERARVSVDTFAPAEGQCAGDDFRLRLDGAVIADDHAGTRCPAYDLVFAEGASRHTLQLEAVGGAPSGPVVAIVHFHTLAVQCGDRVFVPQGGESCDDGNTRGQDGCSEICQVEPVAAPPITADTTLMVAPLLHLADSVGYRIQAAQADSFVTVEALPDDTGFCAAAYAITLHDGTRYLGGAQTIGGGECRRQDVLVGAGVQVLAVRNNSRVPIPRLGVRVTFTPPSCGDGVHGASEACDDGNVAVGDGCDARCGVERGAPELEPNDDDAHATPLYVRGATLAVDVVTRVGSLREGDPVDVFLIDNPSAAPVSVELTVSKGGGCVGYYSADLRDAAGVSVASIAGGPSGCSELRVAALPPGRYYLQLSDVYATPDSYLLDGRFGPVAP